MYRHATALTQYLWIKTPPHQWPIKPSDGCKSSSEACHPNSPSRVEKPYMIFGFLVVDVGNVVAVLLLRFLVFAGAVADQKAREKTICEWFYNHIMKSHEDPPLFPTITAKFWTLYSHRNDFNSAHCWISTSETNRQDPILSLISGCRFSTVHYCYAAKRKNE